MKRPQEPITKWHVIKVPSGEIVTPYPLTLAQAKQVWAALSYKAELFAYGLQRASIEPTASATTYAVVLPVDSNSKGEAQ